VHFIWSTNGADGASITRATNGTVQVYKDNGTTQSTTGVTDTEDFDALTGVHACTIDLSADATFYAAAHHFTVVLAGATIDGKSVNAVLAYFSTVGVPISVAGLTAIGAQVVTSVGDKGDGLFDVATDSLQAIRDRGDAAWASTAAMHTGTAQAGAASTITLAAGASASNNYYNRSGIVITGGTGAGQERLITGYVGATKVATVDEAWVVNPDNTSLYEVGPARTSARQSYPSDGSISSSTFAAGAINAAAIATNAIDDDALATDAVTAIQVAVAAGAVASVTGAVGSVTGNVGGVASGGITSASFAAGAITAAAVATNAIDDDALSADAVTAIQSGLGTSANQATLVGAIAAVQTDVDDLQARTPAALISGRMDVSVGAMAANVMTASAAASDFGAEIGVAVWDSPITEPTGPFVWASAKARDIQGWVGARMRNKNTQTATAHKVRNDADSADIGTSAVSDDGTTATKGKWS
jgi:hypothetical protein